MNAVRVFLINLDRDTARLDWMTRQLAAAGLAFERVPAILGTALPASLAPFFATDGQTIDAPLRPGEIGCYASHLAIHQRLASEPPGTIGLVLEDDLTIDPELARIVAEIGALPPDWDIVRLSNPPKRATATIGVIAGREVVRYSKIPNNTGAYLITQGGARKFLAFEGSRKRAIDEDMRRPWDCGLVTLGIVPPPVRSNVLASSIEAMGGRRGRLRFLPKALTGRTETPLGGRGAAYNIRSLGVGPWLRCLVENILDRLRLRTRRSR